MDRRRISVDPEHMGGIPCIRDLRIPVATVLSMLAGGMTTTDILAVFQELEEEDIREALRYAAGALTPIKPLHRRLEPGEVLCALDNCKWNRRKAAESLNIGYSAIRRYIEKYGLDRD